MGTLLATLYRVMEASRIGGGKVFSFGFGGGWERLELAEARFEVGGKSGVGEGRAVNGGDLLQNACVLRLGDDFVDCGIVCVRGIREEPHHFVVVVVVVVDGVRVRSVSEV